MFMQTDCSAVLRIQGKHWNHLKKQIWREASVPYELRHIYISWVCNVNLNAGNSFVKTMYFHIMFSLFRSKGFYCCDKNSDGMRGKWTKLWRITLRKRPLGTSRRRCETILKNVYVMYMNLRIKIIWFRTWDIGSLSWTVRNFQIPLQTR
jgi:hypothetical protein